MALEERTNALLKSLSMRTLDEKNIKNQIDKISWLPAPEISKELVSKLGLEEILEKISTNTDISQPIRLDADRLLARWKRGVWDAPHNETSYRSAGPGDLGLVAGDCWPSRDMMRKEGCHGVSQAGIYGKAGYGAYSIVTNGLYNDQDDGDKLWYSGTDAKDKGIPSRYTSYLMQSFKTGNPVRVIRGAQSGRFAPSRGCRYDGLYKVKEYQPTRRRFTASPKGEGNYEFLLEKLDDQPPIQRHKPDRETLVNWEQRKLNGRT